MPKARLRVLRLAPLCFLTAGLAAQTPPRVTVEVLYGPEVAATDVTPEHFWAADGSALLLDPRDEHGLLRLDPETGKTTPACDTAKASAALNKAGADGETLEWPLGFDARGRRAVYAAANDVFVLDLPSAEVWRVTQSPDVAEKAPRLSPDGSKVAYVLANDLYVFELASKKTTRLTRDGSDTILNGTLSWVYWEEIFGRADLGYWWSPDSRSLAYLRTDEGSVPLCSFVDFQPATPEVHVQRYPKAGAENPTVTVGCVSVVSTADAPRTVWADLAQQPFEYLCRVTWLPDSQRFAVQTMNRAQDRLELTLVARDTGVATPVLTETDPAWININDDLTFLAGGSQFLWVSERTGFAHIYRYAIDGKLLNAVTAGDWAVHASGAIYWLRQAIGAVDEKAGVVYFSSHRDNSIETQVYRARLDGADASKPTPITSKPGSHAASFAPDARAFLDAFSDARTPPSLSLCRADGTQVAVIAAPAAAALAKYDVAFPELFTVPADDGFPMPAYLFKPKAFDPAHRYPVILHCYGGPSAPSVKNAWSGSDVFYHQMLLDQGFLVACIDNRSATAISKRTENVLLGQMYGDSEVTDLLAGVKWLKAQSYVDPARVGIWGWSGGGSMTLLAMTRSQEFKAGIAVAGVTRWEYYDTKWGEASIKRPQDNPEGYAHCDLTARAKDLHGRLLLVHGTYDDNVHPQNTLHFVDELISAGKLFELQLYPMRKHGIADRKARVHLFTTMIDFWKRSL